MNFQLCWHLIQSIHNKDHSHFLKFHLYFFPTYKSNPTWRWFNIQVWLNHWIILECECTYVTYGSFYGSIYACCWSCIINKRASPKFQWQTPTNNLHMKTFATLKSQYDGYKGDSDGVERQRLAFIQQWSSSPFLELVGIHIRWNYCKIKGRSFIFW
mgnify:CR=1 FL=1